MLFDNMYKNKTRLKMMEYQVSPTSLEQIFHSFAKEQTGGEGSQGVYNNEKELALTSLFEQIDGEAASNTPARNQESSDTAVINVQSEAVAAVSGDPAVTEIEV
jgi:hypothetical protein